MATVLTHALVGGTLARIGGGRVSSLKLGLVLAAMAVLPDLDVVGFWLGIPYGHPLGHRGLSHSLAFAALAGVAVAWLFFPELRSSGPARRRVACLVALATASHGLLDALTDAGRGVGFLLPFHDVRLFLPWRPLDTSPIEIDRLLSRGTVAVLRSEARVVWGPLLLALVVHGWWRRRHPGSGAPPNTLEWK